MSPPEPPRSTRAASAGCLYRELDVELEGILQGAARARIVLACADGIENRIVAARLHMHFTPTYASWLNQVERWFAGLTEKAIRRGSHFSVRELEAAIIDYLEASNANSKPFVWARAPIRFSRASPGSRRPRSSRTRGIGEPTHDSGH
jgi:transposase